ncbi:hypothetical protein [Eubacterium barkeri]|uniref:Uncharacterized protein n=1 Tax=Eubacterium barkeri TaxID=1528 RepID=A0A1H3CFC8_EUBBA|nr:hypothetical protein [Eubacterium barkeri]SDX52796.1 hypothetical protein SAMN04488579_10383 [Eubacterium barkeri]
MKKIYSKITRERKRQFQTETAIFMDSKGKKIVIKRAIHKEGEVHIAKMLEYYTQTNEFGKSNIAACKEVSNGIAFDYIEGISIYELILKALEDGDKFAVLHILKVYLEVFEKVHMETVPFQVEDGFTDLFGNLLLVDELPASRMVNIDLSFDNIMQRENGEMVIIDYEWICDFLVPLGFVKYRALNALLAKHHNLVMTLFDKIEVYQIFGITREEQRIYASMEQAFLDKVLGVNSSSALNSYKKSVIDIQRLVDGVEDHLQVFYDTGNGFNAEQKETYAYKGEDKEIVLSIDLKKIDGLKLLRIDPVEKASLMAIEYVEIGDELETAFTLESSDCLLTNGTKIEGTLWAFDTEDPQIIIDLGDTMVTRLELRMKIISSDLSIIKPYINSLKNSNKKYAEICMRQQKIIDQQDYQLRHFGKLLDIDRVVTSCYRRLKGRRKR